MTTLKLHAAPAMPARAGRRTVHRRREPARTLDATDPRWVLAVRTAAEMQGPLLTPEKRDRLVRMAKIMGLRPFDAHLIIAIVQDQARRGVPVLSAPAAGIEQLAMVNVGTAKPQRSRWRTVALAAAVVAVEAVVIAVLI